MKWVNSTNFTITVCTECTRWLNNHQIVYIQVGKSLAFTLSFQRAYKSAVTQIMVIKRAAAAAFARYPSINQIPSRY